MLVSELDSGEAVVWEVDVWNVLVVVSAAADDVMGILELAEEVIKLVVVAAEDVVKTVEDMLELCVKVWDVVVDDLTIGGGKTNGEQGSVDIKSLAT